MKGTKKMNNLSENLRILRLKNNIKQKNIEESLNIKQRRYSMYETAQREPDVDTLIILADFYKITLDELIR